MVILVDAGILELNDIFFRHVLLVQNWFKGSRFKFKVKGSKLKVQGLIRISCDLYFVPKSKNIWDN